MALIILPGIGGSGEAHWQTLWQRDDPAAVRFRPASWDQPELGDWIAALDAALEPVREPAFLVAHSLACLLVAHWAGRSALAARVAGAFLVAVPDPEGPAFPHEDAASFREVPSAPLPFPALVIASSDDPYGALAYQEAKAAAWQAGFVAIGAHGHINGASGLGVWPEGARLLAAFAAGTRRSRAG